MPLSVQRAYREPIDLLGLLGSSAFLPYKKQVRDQLLSELLSKYGSVEVSRGKKKARPILQIVSSTRDPIAAVGVILDVPDYGPRDSLLRRLAMVMEPYWQQWWETYPFEYIGDVSIWCQVASYVLSERQFLWIAAQISKLSIDWMPLEYRETYIRLIGNCEKYAQSPSDKLKKKVLEDSRVFGYAPPDGLLVDVNPDGSERDPARVLRAWWGASELTYESLDKSAFRLKSSGSMTNLWDHVSFAAFGDNVPRARFGDIVRKLIQPTLLISAVDRD